MGKKIIIVAAIFASVHGCLDPVVPLAVVPLAIAKSSIGTAETMVKTLPRVGNWNPYSPTPTTDTLRTNPPGPSYPDPPVGK